MAGAPESGRLNVWARLSGEFPARIEWGLRPDLSDARHGTVVMASADNDFIVKLSANDVPADRDIHYRVLVDGQPDRYQRGLPAYRTRVAPDAVRPIRIAFGSCARVQEYPVQPIWDAIEAWRPDLFLWLGDNIYADTLHDDILRGQYRLQRAVPEWRRFGAEVPQLAIWDDHDFGLNDHDRSAPTRAMALRAFRDYWLNPGYGTESVPGVFFRYRFADVELFMLDSRYWRDPVEDSEAPPQTLLGAGQLDWLKRALAASDAPFKLIACGSGFNNGKGVGGDSWASFLPERNALFDFIRDSGISGVVLLSGDVHYGEINTIPWTESGGYDFYEIVSSPLAQDAGQGWAIREPEQRIRVPYGGGPNFGLLEIDPAVDDPTLTAHLCDINGRATGTPLRLKRSMLVNGRSSWRETMDPRLAGAQ